MKRDLVIWISLVFVAAVSGCARKSSFSATPQGASPEEEAQIQAADLRSIEFNANNLAIGPIGVTAFDFISGQLAIRTDQITNPTDEPVRVWLKPDFERLHVHGVCSAGRAQYQGDAHLEGYQLTGGHLISKNIVQNDWSEIEVEAHQSASIQWLVGGSFTWIQGPSGAPSESCDQSSSPRGWAGFEIDGSVVDEVRVSPPNVTEAEATGPSNFLDSNRVSVLVEASHGIYEHKGDGW